MLLTEENAIIYHPTSSHEQLGLSLIIKGTPRMMSLFLQH